MKSILLPLLLAGTAFGLGPGDKVTLDAIRSADFIQGEAPEAWKPGQLYVIECWATWCGPCIAAIPHIDGLYDKYQEKGLNVIAMNVWEEPKETAAKFVESKGDGMSYPVAYVGKEGPFVDQWLTAGKVEGIPHAFIVKDGELLFSTHPASLDEEMVEALLAGGDEQQAIVDKVRNREKMEAEMSGLIGEFSEAQQAGDAEKMAAATAAIEKADPDFPHLGRMKIDTALANKDWDAATTQIKALDNPQMALMVAAMSARQFDTTDPAPPTAFLETLTEVLKKNMVPDPTLHASLARLQWKTGAKEDAVASAKAAAEGHGELPKAPFDAFLVSFEKGEPQNLEELIAAIRAAMSAQPGE